MINKKTVYKVLFIIYFNVMRLAWLTIKIQCENGIILRYKRKEKQPLANNIKCCQTVNQKYSDHISIRSKRPNQKQYLTNEYL